MADLPGRIPADNGPLIVVMPGGPEGYPLRELGQLPVHLRGLSRRNVFVQLEDLGAHCPLSEAELYHVTWPHLMPGLRGAAVDRRTPAVAELLGQDPAFHQATDLEELVETHLIAPSSEDAAR